MPEFQLPADKDSVTAFVEASFTEDPRFAIEQGSCVYRGENGAKCAFGRCITDEELGNYQSEGHPNFEGMNAAGVIDRLPQEIKDIYFEIADANWWDSLQSIHDGCSMDEGLTAADLPGAYRLWRESGYPEMGYHTARQYAREAKIDPESGKE